MGRTFRKGSSTIMSCTGWNFQQITTVVDPPQLLYLINLRITESGWTSGRNDNSTVKILKIGTPATIIITVLKMKQWFYDAVMHPKDADGMANSEDPDQTAPSGAV